MNEVTPQDAKVGDLLILEQWDALLGGQSYKVKVLHATEKRLKVRIGPEGPGSTFTRDGNPYPKNSALHSRRVQLLPTTAENVEAWSRSHTLRRLAKGAWRLYDFTRAIKGWSGSLSTPQLKALADQLEEALKTINPEETGEAE